MAAAFTFNLPAPKGQGNYVTGVRGVMSTFAHVGLKLRRPLTPEERRWLTSWVLSKNGQMYFRHHRRLARGLANFLKSEMARCLGASYGCESVATHQSLNTGVQTGRYETQQAASRHLTNSDAAGEGQVTSFPYPGGVNASRS